MLTINYLTLTINSDLLNLLILFFPEKAEFIVSILGIS